MATAVIVDMALIALIAAMIGYCVVLDRRLGRLRDGQAEMIRVAQAFQDAVARAEASLAGFQAAGRVNGERLDRLVAEARTLGDELAFLAERGERSAAVLAGVRPTRAAGDERVGRSATPEHDLAAARSSTERDLAAALRAVR
ncbi:MAG: DUF6468 domain-containing protein [Alphaproteobacteria bacterium]